MRSLLTDSINAVVETAKFLKLDSKVYSNKVKLTSPDSDRMIIITINISEEAYGPTKVEGEANITMEITGEITDQVRFQVDNLKKSIWSCYSNMNACMSSLRCFNPISGDFMDSLYILFTVEDVERKSIIDGLKSLIGIN